MTRLSQRQPWYSRLWQIFLRDRLGIFALMMVVSGFVCLLLPVGAVQGIGGILFGTGLTVTITLWSNRQQAGRYILMFKVLPFPHRTPETNREEES
jgi:hypothetical protein